MAEITQLNLRPTLAEQATQFAKDNPLPPNEDAIRVKGKVENNTGFIAVERTWRNGWGMTTWFAKPKRGDAAGGFDVTKRL
jgi:hypothetical protein